MKRAGEGTKGGHRANGIRRPSPGRTRSPGPSLATEGVVFYARLLERHRDAYRASLITFKEARELEKLRGLELLEVIRRSRAAKGEEVTKGGVMYAVQITSYHGWPQRIIGPFADQADAKQWAETVDGLHRGTVIRLYAPQEEGRP